MTKIHFNFYTKKDFHINLKRIKDPLEKTQNLKNSKKVFNSRKKNILRKIKKKIKKIKKKPLFYLLKL